MDPSPDGWLSGITGSKECTPPPNMLAKVSGRDCLNWSKVECEKRVLLQSLRKQVRMQSASTFNEATSRSAFEPRSMGYRYESSWSSEISEERHHTFSRRQDRQSKRHLSRATSHRIECRSVEANVRSDTQGGDRRPIDYSRASSRLPERAERVRADRRDLRILRRLLDRPDEMAIRD